MKIPLAVCILFATLSCTRVEGKSFRFGDFFFGAPKETSDIEKRSSSPPLVVQDDQPSNDSIEIDYLANSTSYGEFIDWDLWNSSDSYGIVQNSSIHNVIDDETTAGAVPSEGKQSVKKVLQNNDDPSSTVSELSVTGGDGVEVASTSVSESTEVVGLNTTSNADELEEVVLGTTKAPVIPTNKTIFQKSIEWVEDAYTLSILIPVAAGVLFATTCITTIAICGCMRRCCRRRRLRRKVLPDSVKSLRASDRKRLLGDCTSDEEF